MHTGKHYLQRHPKRAEARTTPEWSGTALARASGAPLVAGNRVRLLKDAIENYPAWIDAIESAEQWVHFETYVIHEDSVGRQFAELFSRKARSGVKVRLIYDWIGSFGNTSSRFWARLVESGVDVRCYNRPSLMSPFGWVSRDHRKMLSVDGRIAYVTGLCVGERWVGIPAKGLDPWRDTGVEIEGPALIDIEHAFADSWAATGEGLPSGEIPSSDSIAQSGDLNLRVVASVPTVGSVYRLDQLVTTLVQNSLWLADAYFIGTSSYVQALRAAAQSGIDVRLLVPGANDVPIMRALARSGLRPLLEAGVRVFEWNGAMMHAKTAVADGQWARVGSTNLNLTSWLGNRELDVIVEDRRFARQMEEAYLEDLTRSTEIVIGGRQGRPIAMTLQTSQKPMRAMRASGPSRTAAGVMRLGHAVGAAITNRRELGPAEAVIMFWAAAFLAVFSAVALYWPRGVVWPIVTLCLWLAVTLLIRAVKLRARRR